ncbi:MAG: hypothetical protein IT383_28085 [Deltaproteobacteria bacterium]|nr:hypothetical protein [Deltaproteobacteria bacterium]
MLLLPILFATALSAQRPPSMAVPPAPSPEPAPAPAADARPGIHRVAVYELTSAGVDERVTVILTASITAELRKLQGMSVIGMDEVRAMLDHEAQKQLMGCGDDSCIAEIAEALGVDTLVVGSAAKVGEEHVFGLRRLDQRQGKAVGQVDQRLKPDNGEEFLGVVGPAVEALFPDFPLKAGRTRGVSNELAIRLNPPPFDPWVFWTGVGVTGASLVGAAATTYFWNGAETSLQGFVTSHAEQGKQADGDQLAALTKSADDAAMVAIVAWSVSGALAIATAATAGFVDWMGYRADVQLDAN